MLLGNLSLAVLQRWAGPEEERAEPALPYVLLLLPKLLLNACVLVLSRRSLPRSLVGHFLLSLCLADALLAAALAGLWLQGGCRGDVSSLAFLLAHASAAYAALPLPVLALGALDLAARGRWGLDGWGLARGRAGAVLALWLLAGLCSARWANPSVWEVELGAELGAEPGARALVCEVQRADQVSLFCLLLLAAIALTLAPHLPRLPRWTRLADRLCAERDEPAPLGGVLAPVQPSGPPLGVGCVLLFALHWGSYLLVHLGSELLQQPVPAYASVNALWLSCANSLLVGVAYWRQAGRGAGREAGAIAHSLDAICKWRIVGYLSYHDNGGLPPHKLPQELQTPSERNLKPLLLL